IALDQSWVSPPCGTLPGTYVVRFSAESAMSGKVDEEEVQLTVIRCHVAEIDASGFSACEEEAASSQASLRNEGNMDDTFDITVSPSWVTVKPASVSAGELSSASFSMNAVPPKGSHGTVNVTIKAASRNTYASAEKTIALAVKRCTYFSAAIVSPQDGVCLGDEEDYYLNIDNKGTRDDRYKITAPSWVALSEDSVSVGAGKRKTLKLSISPVSAGQKKITVYVSSLNYPTEIVPVESVVSVTDCRDASLLLDPPELAVCRGGKASFTAILENTGNTLTSYGLRFFIGGMSSSEEVTLSPGESQEMTLDVDTDTAGKYPVAAEASVGNRSVAFASAVLSVGRCYDATLSLPPSATVCLGDAAKVAVSVRNTGSMKDYYTLAYPEGSENFYLTPGEKTDMELSIATAYPWGSVRNVTFALSSRNGVKTQGAMAITTLEKDECYAVSVPGEEEGLLQANALRGKGTAAVVVLRNAGARSDTYDLSIEGPDWAYLSTEKVALAPGENATAYVYLSPSYDAQEGTYNITVIAESKNAFKRILLSAAVADSFPDAEPSSLGGLGLSGMLIGSAIASQSAILSLMALLTAVIVLMRFVIYR
ncbi:MAG: hypothetical protein V1813_00005, partial [Candidatus Aenigmatarchaeota archaeon]